MKFLEGKKTIITGIVMIVYAVSGLILGHLDHATAMQIGGTGLGMIFLRMGMENKWKKKDLKKIELGKMRIYLN